MATYGYIRVSSREQNEARQRIALGEWGIAPEEIFIDRQSGKDFHRPGWQKLMKRLRSGDLLVVQSIDRLGRNYEEILEQWRWITKERQADVLVLDMPLLDTRAKEKDLTGTFIADLVLQILSYVAQTERENIRRRQAEGIAAAKARGVRFGAAKKPLPPGFAEVQRAYLEGRIPLKAAAGQLGMSVSTFCRKVKLFPLADSGKTEKKPKDGWEEELEY